MPIERRVSCARAIDVSITLACGTTSTTGSRYTGLKGCTTSTLSGRGTPAPNSDGLKPEVDEPISAEGGIAA